MRRRAAAVAGAGLAAALVAGCGAAHPARHAAPPPVMPVYTASSAPAAAYAQAHPVPPVPGTVPAVVISTSEAWTASSNTWTGTAVTAAGQRLAVTCTGSTYGYGSPGGVLPGPDVGDYVYWPASCHAGVPAGIRIIRTGAVGEGS